MTGPSDGFDPIMHGRPRFSGDRGDLPAAALAALVFGLVFTVSPAAAHGPLHEQIESLTLRIEADPRDATLYVKRGRLHGHHRDWEQALADYDRAGRLDPAVEGLSLARGRTLLDAGRHEEAKAELDRFLASHPRHAAARAYRARACRALGENRAAAEDYARAIAAEEEAGAAPPELYLERARALAAEGAVTREEALRVLDEGLARRGPVPALQLYAIDLEVAGRRYDEALARVAAAAALSPRPESWWARRGRILEAALRPEEARIAYEKALADLSSRSGERGPTAAAARHEREVRSALARLPRLQAAEAEP